MVKACRLRALGVPEAVAKFGRLQRRLTERLRRRRQRAAAPHTDAARARERARVRRAHQARDERRRGVIFAQGPALPRVEIMAAWR